MEVQSGCRTCPHSPTRQSSHSTFPTSSFPFLSHVHVTSKLIIQTLQHPSHSSSPPSLAIVLNHRIICIDDRKISQHLSLSTLLCSSYNLDFLIISKMSIQFPFSDTICSLSSPIPIYLLHMPFTIRSLSKKKKKKTIKNLLYLGLGNQWKTS